MQFVALALSLIRGYKTYSTVVLAVASGVGMILTKNYSNGLSEILQALSMVFGGASVVGLKGTLTQLSSTPGQGAPSQPAKAS